MPSRCLRIAGLLFCSGLCALVYQVAWLRELRLVFGASTPASAAVLAVFMGGLGFGSLRLSKRADESERPLALYGNLEAGIALFAALTPLLLWAARAAYVALGGSPSLGLVGGTLVRLLLSALVLLPPTFLMGGTLPAAARAAMPVDDVGRGSTALLYGLNTLGAVTGAALSTFILLEIFGTRLTLWLGCAVNGLVAVAARAYDRRLAEPVLAPSVPDAADDSDAAPAAPLRFTLVAAAVVGLVFLLMELVWYRMLSPLLGGSSYTFGLILAVALFGIGVGGLTYTLVGGVGGRRLPSLIGFGISCALEALLLALPFALGDRIALLALLLRDLGHVGLAGHVVGWTVVAAVVVLPAAIVAGYQFPLLIALLGRSGPNVGRHVGLAYACNTLGAIVGSLAGGFVLLPWLGALGCWQLGVWLLIGLSVAAIALTGARSWRRLLAPALLALISLVAMHASVGPTAAWRHSPIGAGRAEERIPPTRRGIEQYFRAQRRAITWEVDGRESTVGLNTLNDTSFIVSGKSDGAAVTDSGTQVMSGLLAAMLHPRPVKRALVIGLGTGSTAGWLAALPDIERVDVVELEPAIVHVAEVCAPVNHDVLANPKVNLIIGDAREVLLTTGEDYDLIFSEPSNPYRAGIASLFTVEFYTAVADKLREDGVFVQWVQTYEIDAKSVRTVYATLAQVFPSVESWRTQGSDLILMGRAAALPVDRERVAARMRQSPYREALNHTWRATTVEDVLARFVARPGLAVAVAEAEGADNINTDDRNLLEFSIARAIGQPNDFSVSSLMATAHARGESQPEVVGDVRWQRIYDAMIALAIVEGEAPSLPVGVAPGEAMQHRFRALHAWHAGSFPAVIAEWQAQPQPPRSLVEVMVLAEAHATMGEAEPARALIEALAAWQPIEADALRARLAFSLGEHGASWQALSRALAAYAHEPWPNLALMRRTLPLALALAKAQPDLAPEILAALEQPAAVSMLDYLRLELWLSLALERGDAASCRRAVAALEPHFPWQEPLLRQRIACFELGQDGRLPHARAELAAYLADSGVDFGAGLRPAEPAPMIQLEPAAPRE